MNPIESKLSHISRRNRIINYSYIFVFTLAFLLVFFLLFSHINLHSRYKDEIGEKFPVIDQYHDAESSELPYFANISGIKEGMYDVYIGQGQSAGLGVAVLPDTVISLINHDDLYIKTSGKFHRLERVAHNRLLAVYSIDTELSFVDAELFADYSSFDITDGVALFTRINDSYTFSPGIVSSKHSMIDESILIETDIRFPNPPRGSLLLSEKGLVIGFSLMDIDGSINLFVSANELFSIKYEGLDRFLNKSGLILETYERAKSTALPLIGNRPGKSSYSGIRVESIVLNRGSATELYMSFFLGNQLYTKPFDADIIIEMHNQKQYRQKLKFTEDSYKPVYLPDRTIEGVRMDFEIKESGPAVLYIDFEDYRSQYLRIYIRG